MNGFEPSRYDDVVRSLRDWPAEERWRLIQDLIQTLRPVDSSTPRSQNTLSRARGLLKSDRPPPSDEEVTQWLDEARLEKYG